MPNRSDQARRILGRIEAQSFVGRGHELQQISASASFERGRRGVLLLAAPSAGASELLRQTYDRFFAQPHGASPIYFALSRSDYTTVAAAHRFFRTFLVQLIAHRRRDASLLVVAAPTFQDLIDLSLPADYEWVRQLVQSYERARTGGDVRAFVRLCLSAPDELSSRGVRSLVMLDDVHLADQLSGDADLGAEIAQAAAHDGTTAYVLAGLRRRVMDVLQGAGDYARLNRMRKIHLERLHNDEARTLIERLASSLSVPLSDETRDLIVHQFAGNVLFFTSLIQAAYRNGVALTTFLDCQRLYVDELMGGQIGRYFHSLLETLSPDATTRRAIVRTLHEASSGIGGKISFDALRSRFNIEPDNLQRMIGELYAHELASMDGTFLEVGSEPAWRDFLRVTYRLQIAADPRALVVAETLIGALKRAPQTVERHYRREAALNLRELLGRFNFQRVPASLLHNDRFNISYGRMIVDEVTAGLESETDLVRLPQVVATASCASFQPAIRSMCDEERCMIAHGFDAMHYTEANEIVWAAAEINSKAEVERPLAEQWYERLTQLASDSNLHRVRLWLVAAQGFSEEANEFLNERGAFGSNRYQLELLTSILIPEADSTRREVAPDEFEMVIPMGGDTELIAARTVEQIARRLPFQPEAINQIKTALVEACINAAEHSSGPDRRIHQRFEVGSDKLIVTVSSRGGATSRGAPSNNESSPAKLNNAYLSGSTTNERQDWGLKIIRTLMDEVEFERADNTARLRMTKYLHKH